jgi:hypothetical protein
MDAMCAYSPLGLAQAVHCGAPDPHPAEGYVFHVPLPNGASVAVPVCQRHSQVLFSTFADGDRVGYSLLGLERVASDLQAVIGRLRAMAPSRPMGVSTSCVAPAVDGG